MSRDIEALPIWAKMLAYTVLGIGWLATVVFVGWYGWTRPWYLSDVGRHLMAMSGCVGAFFTLYLLLAIWPELPGRSIVRLVLLVLLVATVVHRLVLLARQDRADRQE